jgi:hypothetical protein
MRIVVIAVLFLSSTAAASSEAATVAVLPPEFSATVSEGARSALSQRLGDGLRAAAFAVLSAEDVTRRLADGQLVPGCEGACLAQLAQRLRARYLVRAAVAQVERSYDIHLRLLRGATGETAAELRDRCDTCGLEEVAERMSLAAAALRARLETLAVGPARLVVRSRPGGAVVALDGRVIGRTPLVREVSPGRHVLRLEQPDAVAAERTVVLVASLEEHVDVAMVRADQPEAPRAPAALAYAKLGGLIPTSKLGAGAAVQLGAGYVPPILRGRLAGTIDLAYGQGSASGTVLDPRLGPEGAGYSYRFTQHDLCLFIGPQVFILDPAQRIVPYAALGLEVHFLESVVEGSSAGSPLGENRELSTKAGFAVRGGAGYRLGPGMIVGEVAIAWAPLDHTTTGDSHLGRVALLVGYQARFPFGR